MSGRHDIPSNDDSDASEAKEDFEWWDIDGDELGAALYGVLSPVQLTERTDNSWQHFADEQPAAAYAWLVGIEHGALNESIVALRIIQKMLTLRTFPVLTGIGDNIGREEWLRLLLDVGLFRFASVRDQACNLVTTLYELNLAPAARSIRAIERSGTVPPPVVALLKRIADVGERLRRERNARAHDGRQRPLGHEYFFKPFSMHEAAGHSGIPSMGVLDWVDGELVETERAADYDFNADYDTLVSGLAEEFLPECRKLTATVRELVDEMAEDFTLRYAERRSPADPPLSSE